MANDIAPNEGTPHITPDTLSAATHQPPDKESARTGESTSLDSEVTIPKLEIPKVNIAGVDYEIPQPDTPNRWLKPNTIVKTPPDAPRRSENRNDPISADAWDMYREELAQFERQSDIRSTLKANEAAEKETARKRGYTPPPLSVTAEAALKKLSAETASTSVTTEKQTSDDKNDISANNETSERLDTNSTPKSFISRLLGLRISRRGALTTGGIASASAVLGRISGSKDGNAATPSQHATTAPISEINAAPDANSTPESKDLQNKDIAPNSEPTEQPTLSEQLTAHELHLTQDGWGLNGNIEDVKKVLETCRATNTKKAYEIIFEDTTTSPAIRLFIDPTTEYGFSFSEGVSLTRLEGSPTNEITSYRLPFFPTNSNLNVFFQETTENTKTGEKTLQDRLQITPEDYASDIHKYDKETVMGETIEVITEERLDNIARLANVAGDLAVHGSGIRDIRILSNTPTIKWGVQGEPDSGLTVDSAQFKSLTSEYLNEGYIEVTSEGLKEVLIKAESTQQEAVFLFQNKFTELQQEFKNAMMRSAANGANASGLPSADYYSAFRQYRYTHSNSANPSTMQDYKAAEQLFVDIGITLKEGWTGFKGFIETHEEEGVMTETVRDHINEACSLYINTLFKMNGDNPKKLELMLGTADWGEVSEFINYERWAGEHTLSFPKDQ